MTLNGKSAPPYLIDRSNTQIYRTGKGKVYLQYNYSDSNH